jgi:glycosyltransferase involved in cell wall biosynthesis
MKFTIVVPTYNEEKDIVETLDALIALDYDDKEILIVDDSTDSTPKIVKSYENKGVQLIHPGGGGRCEARNLGIKQATGEIVCILNADVRLPSDFLQRIAFHYENGADYLLVGSQLSNRHDLFARYIGCVGDSRFNQFTDTSRMEWTEGFSCRKEVALKAGLFPTDFVVPIYAGEDGFFGTGLRQSGAKKVVDFSIVVDHVAPASLSEYWSIRKGRGMGSAQIHRFVDKWSFTRIIIWNSLKTVRTFIYSITLIPALFFCWKVTRYSDRKAADLFPFLYAWLIEKLAFHTGEWQATFQIIKKEKKHGTRRR